MTNRFVQTQQLIKEYQKSLLRCNPKQRLVVETIEGPMMVVSGPGTGKTTMVTLRIAHLLHVQDTKPENILCFSFTNAACTELRTRLEARIGGIAAHKVNVTTFHSFANDVLMQHLDYLGIGYVRTISELEKIEIVKNLIDHLPTTNPLRRLKGDQYFEVTRLIWLSQVMREEGWSPAELCSKIDDYCKDLPNIPDYQYKRKYTDKKTGITYLAGDPNTSKIEEVVRQMEFTKAAIQFVPQLQSAVMAQGYYDYADMIVLATRILQDNEGLRRFIQERYQYIIVDEFQDTSGSQLQLLELLLEYWMPNANVLLVGDPDQMIMGFQGAHSHSQTEFLEKLKPYLQTVSMDDNYRSCEGILLSAHSVIENNTNRLRLQPLNAAHPSIGKLDGLPSVRQYATPTDEVAHIASELLAMYRQGKNLSEVFCLFPKHRLYEEFILALDGLGVPYQVQRPIDLLSHRTALMVLSVFEYVAIECDRFRQGEGEHLLFDMLHFPWVGVSHADVSRITRYIWQHEKPRPSWFDVITNPDALQNAGCNDVERILKAGNFIGQIMAQAFAKASVLETYRTILQDGGGGLLAWIMKQPDALLHLDVLNGLHRFLNEQTDRKPYLTAYDVVQIIADMQSEGLRVSIQRTGGNPDGVKVMTLHAAKGMEADRVYMVGCRKDLMDDSAKRGGSQYKLPPDVTRTAFDDGGEEERRKLFYVGITRARKELFVSYSTTDANGKEKGKSAFVAEMLEGGYAAEEIMHVSPNQLLQYQAAAISVVRASADNQARLTDVELDDMLRGYKLSPTHLNIYLRCPREFYLYYVLRAPRPKNLYAAFGTAVDEALRHLHQIGVIKALAKKQNQETNPEKQAALREMLGSKYGEGYEAIVALTEDEEKDALLSAFEAAMRRGRGYFPSQIAWENRMEYGKAQLLVFFEHYRPSLPGMCHTGYSLSNVHMDNIPLTGEIDNLVWVGQNEVRVEDWKTGSPKNGAAKVNNVAYLADGITPELIANPDAMGDYRRQIYFYKLLIDHHSTLLLKPVAGKVRFIESHDTNNVPIVADVDFKPEETQLVKRQIEFAYNGIMQKQFSRGCNDPLCPACKFFDQNGISI